MTYRLRAAALSLLLAIPTLAHAAPLDPRTLPVGGPRTTVLVLGTPHLSQLPKSYDNAHLAPLLDRLAAWKPTIITIEALPGPDCEYLNRYKALTPGIAETYCWDASAAQKAIGMDTAAATVAIDAALKSWPANPAPGARRRLAALFLAANDRASALVQWLRLPAGERRAGDGLDAASIAVLETQAVRRNENYAIAAALAARLGLERVYPADDHSADTITAPLGDDFGTAIQAIWSQPSPFRDDYKRREAAVSSAATLLAFYRYMNDPATNRFAVESDMGAALKDAKPPYWGRQYVAWWEVRNLRMAANIRAAFGNHPGARVLSIVGASHKAHFESYLGMMSEVTIADAQRVLR